MKYLDNVGLAYFLEKLKTIIGSYVTAEDPVSITDTIPPTFDGYLSSDFALKNDLDSHSDDTVIHVTNAERDTWNGVVGAVNVINATMLSKSGGTMTGQLVAQSNDAYDTAQTRNIIIGNTDIGDGSELATGTIYLVYE